MNNATTPYNTFDTPLDPAVCKQVVRFMSRDDTQQLVVLRPSEQLMALTGYKHEIVFRTLNNEIVHHWAFDEVRDSVDFEHDGQSIRFNPVDPGAGAIDSQGLVYRHVKPYHYTSALAAALEESLRNFVMEYKRNLVPAGGGYSDNHLDICRKPDIGLGSSSVSSLDEGKKAIIGLGLLPEPNFTLDDVKTFLAGCYLESQSAWTLDNGCTKLVMEKEPAKQLHEVYARLYYGHLIGTNKMTVDPEQRIDYAIFERLKRIFGDPFKDK